MQPLPCDSFCRICQPRRGILGVVVAIALAVLAGLVVGPGRALAEPAAPAKESNACQQRDLFVAGQDGYHTYRIPALIVSKKGSLLAFCEGRKAGRGDSGSIDILLKRSSDAGKSWSAQQVVWTDEGNTCGNPCPVVDQQTGVVWLLMTWNRGDDPERKIIDQTSKDTRRVFVASSDDDGATWTPPKEITSDVKKADWTWYATGPGNGIQTTRGSHPGRLVIPCDHIEAVTKQYYSHVVFSDDHGKTWQLGGASPRDQANECAVVELGDGGLLLNMRSYSKDSFNRQVCLSRDGGVTWQEQEFDQTLVEPRCQASLFRLGWPDSDGRNGVLFSNPASKKRENMTVRLSRDDGKSWPMAKSLFAGPAAYSSLAVMADGSIACLYERGDQEPYEKITLAMFSLEWLTGTPPK